MVERETSRATRPSWGRRRSYSGPGRRRTDREPNRGWIPAGLIALTVALTDWAVKLAVAARVPLEGFLEVWPDRVALWHLRNDAMILGLYGDFPLSTRKAIAFFCGIAGLVLLHEVTSRGHRLPPSQRGWAWLFVGLALGGMLGNLGERVVHWGVTDYLSFRWGDIWLPPGNIADLAIFLSIPVSFLVIAFELRARAQRARPRAASDAAVELARRPDASGATAAGD